MTTMDNLLELLALHGGKIVSTASLAPEWIEQARASNRIYVNESGLSFVWEPDIKCFPETVEEVEWFEKWHPLKIELPEKLKSLDWMNTLNKEQAVIQGLRQKGGTQSPNP